MPLHYRITVPGLSVERDFTVARQRLLADFPDIHEVIATTSVATLLVVYSGPEDPRAWAQTLRELPTGRRATAIRTPPSRCAESSEGDDPAA